MPTKRFNNLSLNRLTLKANSKEEAPLKQIGVIASNGESEENALLFGVTSNSFLIPKIEKGKNLIKIMMS